MHRVVNNSKHLSSGKWSGSHENQEKKKLKQNQKLNINKGPLHKNTYRQHYLQEVTRGVLISWFPHSQHSSEPSSNGGTTETCREKQRRGSELVTKQTTTYSLSAHTVHIVASANNINNSILII